MDCIVHGVSKSQTWLSDFHFMTRSVDEAAENPASSYSTGDPTWWTLKWNWVRQRCVCTVLWPATLFLGTYPEGGLTGGAVVENQPANAGDARHMGLIPGFGRSPGEGNGNPLLYSCLGNSKDRGAWRATVHGVSKNWTQLSTHTYPEDALQTVGNRCAKRIHCRIVCNHKMLGTT